MRQIIFDGKAVLADSSYPPEAWIVNADGRHEINKTVRELRQRVGLVYRGVDIRMQSIMRVPWQLRQGDNVLWYSEDDTVPDKFAWLEDLPDYIGLIEACLCLTSQSFIYKQRNRAGVRGLQWFSPLSVAPEWDEAAGLKHFERRLSNRVDYYKPDDIVYVWRRDPLHETMPDTAPAQAAMASANVLYSIDQFVTGFFQRGAIKPMLLQVPQNTPQAERDKVKAWWDRFFSGVKDAWRTNVVSTEVKPVVVGEGLESLTNETLTQERRDDVATAIGVPHSLLFSNSANYATAKQDEQNFYTMTILPDVRLIQKQLNAQLFKALGLQLRFMPNEMDVFQEDEAARAQSFATYVGAGMKQSVAAQILGVELPDGVEYADLDPEPPAAPVIVQAPPQQPPALPEQPQDEQSPPEDDAQVQADATKAVEVATFKRWLKRRPKADPCEFKSAILTDAEKHAIADDVRGEVAPEESFFTLPSGGITRDVYKALTLQLDPGDDEAEQKLRMAVEGRTYREMRRALRDMMDTLYPENWDTDDPNGEAARIHRAFLRDQKLRDTVSRAIQDSADLGVNMSIDTMENIGIAFDYTLAHEAARAWALTYTDDLLNQLGTTSGRLAGQAVARWFENGEPLKKLINDLDPVFGRKRAQLIAATEVTRAAAEGTRAGYKQSGVITELVWQTARAEKVCPYCGALHGQVVGIDANFSDALPEDLRAKVGRFQLPPAHPRCRCWVVPSVRNIEQNELSEAVAVAQPQTPVSSQNPAEARSQILEIQKRNRKEIGALYDEIDKYELGLEKIQDKQLTAMIDARGATSIAQQSRIAKKLDNLNKDAEALIAKKEVVEVRLKSIQDGELREMHKFLHVDSPSDTTVYGNDGADISTLPSVIKGRDEFNKLVSNSVWNRKSIGIDKLPMGGRAYQIPGQKIIAVAPDSADWVVVHELGHCLEESPEIRWKVREYYNRRTAGDVEEKMGDLTNLPYGDHEVTKKDKWLDPYMGKVYPESTEIVSMGVELMYRDPARFATEDPETFDFIFNLLRGR